MYGLSTVRNQWSYHYDLYIPPPSSSASKNGLTPQKRSEEDQTEEHGVVVMEIQQKGPIDPKIEKLRTLLRYYTFLGFLFPAFINSEFFFFFQRESIGRFAKKPRTTTTTHTEGETVSNVPLSPPPLPPPPPPADFYRNVL